MHEDCAYCNKYPCKPAPFGGQGEQTMKHFTDIEKDEIKQAVFKISDAYWALKRIGEESAPRNTGDFDRMVSDLKEIVNDPGGSVGYFTSIL